MLNRPANRCTAGPGRGRVDLREEPTPRSTKRGTIELQNQSVTNVCQRVPAAMSTTQNGEMGWLWDSWPALASALVALDLELRTPVEAAYGWPNPLG